MEEIEMREEEKKGDIEKEKNEVEEKVSVVETRMKVGLKMIM